MITIELKDDAIHTALRELGQAMSDMSPVMDRIGEALAASTKLRFQSETSPEGAAWASRSPVTIAHYQRTGTRYGRVLQKSGQLGNSIFHEFGPDYVRVGSPDHYAAMMQFGGTRAAFPHLWGDIPARPFLGLSDDDREGVLETISMALQSAFGAP